MLFVQLSSQLEFDLDDTSAVSLPRVLEEARFKHFHVHIKLSEVLDRLKERASLKERTLGLMKAALSMEQTPKYRSNATSGHQMLI